MLHDLLATLAGFVIFVISAMGYPGIVLLMAIESACIPLPSEIIMPFAGYLAYTGEFNLLMAATMGAIGCNLGSVVAYSAAYHGGRPFINRWGRWLLISPRDVDRAERFFARYGSITIFIGRLLPVVRTFIAVPAGLARMPLLKFHVYTFVGSWLWCYALAYVGYALGEAWNTDPRLRAFLHQFDVVIVAVLLSLGIWHVWRHLRERPEAEPTGEG